MNADPIRVKAIFLEAVEKHTSDAWDSFLVGACDDDGDLRRQVEILLGAHKRAGTYLEQAAIVSGRRVDQPITEHPGTVIGPYKLLQQIGEGGMGVVFMAEQTEPIQRTVALKIIKPGMDTRQVIARFEAERQAVAMMDHPNIAKVLDAGTTDSGRPYFVMELVKGVPITKYCDDNHLPLRARLELFVQVCQAVQHAHQKGIIHRDIKPNNVLVAEYDNQAVPKVIDFGVAKATAQRLTKRTMFTEFGQLIGTMEYMSPEQSKFNQLDIDTRSDIYSLGVLLYELLAGSTPFEGKRLHAAAFDEMLRIIREEEPPKPSTRLSSIDTLPSIAVNRHTEPARLSKDVRGELDWIVMKALEKDRNRRYETASGFAADIERHLHDEPVQACPPSVTYRFRKFARRNKGPVAAVAAVLLALVLGLALSTIGFIQASRQRAIAQSNAARADREANNARIEAEKLLAVNNFFTHSLRLATPGRKDATVSQVLDQAGRKLEEGYLKGRPEIEASLRNTLYFSYRNIGQFDVAERHLRRAIELARQFYGPDHPVVAGYLHDLCAELLPLQERWTEAEPIAREALAMYQMIFGEGSLETIIELNVLRWILEAQGKADEAEEVFREALAIVQKSLREKNVEIAKAYKGFNLNLPAKVADAMEEVAHGLQARNKFSEAEALYRYSLALRRKEFWEAHEDVGSSLSGLADVLRAQGRNNEAEELFRQSVAIQRKVGADSAPLAITITRLAEVLVSAGNLSEAEVLHREALALRRKVFVEESGDVGSSLELLTNVLRTQGKTAEIAEPWRQRLQYWQKELSTAEAPQRRAEIHLRMFWSLMRTGQVEEAKASCRKALELNPTYAGAASALNGHAWELATSIDPAHRDAALAVELAEKAVELSPDDGNNWNTLGVARYRAADYRRAVTDLEKSVQLQNGGHAADFFFLAMAHQRLGDPEAAGRWYEKAVQWMDQSGQQNEEFRRFRTEAQETLSLKPTTQPPIELK